MHTTIYSYSLIRKEVICIYIYIYAHVNMNIDTHKYTYIHTSLRTCIHARTTCFFQLFFEICSKQILVMLVLSVILTFFCSWFWLFWSTSISHLDWGCSDPGQFLVLAEVVLILVNSSSWLKLFLLQVNYSSWQRLLWFRSIHHLGWSCFDPSQFLMSTEVVLIHQPPLVTNQY